MFWPAKVAKVRVFCLKSALSKVIDSLHDFGDVQLVVPKVDGLEKVVLEKDFSSLQRQVRLESLFSGKESSLVEVGKKLTEDEASKILNQKQLLKVEKKIAELWALVEKKSVEVDVLKEELKKLRVFEKFDFDFSVLNVSSVEVVCGFVSKANRAKVLGLLESNGVVFDERRSGQDFFVLIFALEKNKVFLLDSLAKVGFERTALPNIDSCPAVQVKKQEAKLGEALREIERLKAQIRSYEKKWFGKLVVAKELLEFRDYKSSAYDKALMTSYSCVVEAFVPEKKVRKLVSYLNSSLNSKAFVEVISSKELEASHEKVPTIFENYKALAPFEFMTKFISVPKGYEIDPTILFTLFFPIFYGMIVGDVVYGLISFLLAKLIFDRVSNDSILKPVSGIWMYGAIPSIFFGFLYDEYAGFSHHNLLGFFGFDVVLYNGFERMHFTELILTASILLGVFTMAIGFLLGFVNASRHGHKKHALAKLAWFFIVTFGTVLVSTFMFNAFPDYFLLPSALIVAICVAFVIKEEGIIGAIEIPGVVGNILSFARIIAVGLVGTVIASILNTMALPSVENGFLIVFMLPLFIFGHLFNAFLAMFEALVQGARLNVVEFYSKFFEGGGEEFSPFRFNSKYLKLKEVD